MAEAAKRLRWYAVRCVNTRVMDRVKKDISLLGIKTFVPRAYRMEKKGKWMVAVDDGYLFPPYIFVAMRAPGPWKSRNSALWGELADVRGVARIMGNRNRSGDLCPIAVPYKEMRKLRTKDRAGERRSIETRFKPGQAVRVVGGNFSGFDGVFEKPVKERVEILLKIFGRSTKVEIDEEDVRAA